MTANQDSEEITRLWIYMTSQKSLDNYLRPSFPHLQNGERRMGGRKFERRLSNSELIKGND